MTLSPEEPVDFTVIGAGPAGAFFAHLASEKGYRVLVYEAAEPGLKPCGWAVPLQIERLIRVPGDVILADIRGFKIYLDGELIKENHGGKWGYIIDKRAFLTYLLEGVELVRRAVPLDPETLRPLNPSRIPPGSEAVIAVGSATPRRDTLYINAVQQLFRADNAVEEDMIELWFDRNLVGYYWVFPRGRSLVDIGVGGFADFNKLEAMLTSFAHRRLGRILEPLSPVRGARINIGGVNVKMINRKEYPVIGEAAGFVYPLTGEGIRPSMESAKALLEGMEKGAYPSILAHKLVAWIERQKGLVIRVREASPATRAAVLRSLPVEAFTSIGLGELKPGTAAKLLVKMPASVARILKALI